MKKMVSTTWIVLMFIVIAYGLVKVISGEVAENLQREVSGLTYIVCALAGLIGLLFSQSLLIQRRLDSFEQKTH